MQKFVGISGVYFKPEHCKFLLNFKFNQNIINGTSARYEAWEQKAQVSDSNPSLLLTPHTSVWWQLKEYHFRFGADMYLQLGQFHGVSCAFLEWFSCKALKIIHLSCKQEPWYIFYWEIRKILIELSLDCFHPEVSCEQCSVAIGQCSAKVIVGTNQIIGSHFTNNIVTSIYWYKLKTTKTAIDFYFLKWECLTFAIRVFSVLPNAKSL